MAWSTLSSKLLLKDRWIDLRADRCLTPEKVEIDPYYVLAYPDWVHVVALTPGRDLVLVKQYRHAAGQDVLELPGGCVDATDADLQDAARRELVEETGYVAPRWLHLSSLYPNPATQTNRVHAFLALDAVAARAQDLDLGEEGLQVRTMPFDDVLARVHEGLLGQSMHVAALLLAARLMSGTHRPAALAEDAT